jgi:hypothetical protein
MKDQIGVALVVLAVLSIAGCVDIRDPETMTLEVSEASFSELPEITLVRRVIPRETTKKVGFFADPSETKEVTSSKFGAPNEIANLNCVIDGMRDSFPDVEIVPTETFWSHVAGLKEEMTLSKILSPPSSNKWQELHIDFLVAAYHEIADLEMFVYEAFAGGLYHDIDRETAATVVIDLPNRTVLNGSKAVFEDDDGVGHFSFVIPLVFVDIASSDPCKMVGQASGAAISSATLKPSPRVVVVAAGNDPYTVTQAVIDKEKQAVIDKDKLEWERATREPCKVWCASP